MQITAPPPALAGWLHLVFAVLSGQMAAVGLLLIPFAARLWRGARLSGLAVIGLAGAGCASVGLMSAVNFTLGSDFRWTLIAPAALWLAATALAWRPGTRAGRGSDREARRD
jgi:hypothetical protein